VLSVLIPQVRDDLGTTTAAVTAGITVYMVPFAAPSSCRAPSVSGGA
jgi:hypothetical protein